MKVQAEATGIPSRVSTVLVLCGFCVGMAAGVPAAKADIFPHLEPGGPLPHADWYIASDKAEYALGEPVHVTYRAVNNTSSVITLGFTGEPVLDLHVLRDGQLVWDSAWWGYLPSSRLVVLDPGEVLETQFVWDQADLDGNLVGPGEYELKGVPRGSGQSASTMITILPEPCVGLLFTSGAMLLLRRKTGAP